MKGTVGMLFVLASATWKEDDDGSCVFSGTGIQGGKQQRNKKKKKTNGSPSPKALLRRANKKVRQRQLSKIRDSAEVEYHIYEHSNMTYVKNRGRLERKEDRFSDRKLDIYQWEDIPLHGPHKEGVIPRDMEGYDIIMRYRSFMLPKTKKRVSWADEKKKKLVRYIAPRKPVNCYLAHRDCFMRMKCYCMVDDPNKKPIMPSLKFNK